MNRKPNTGSVEKEGVGIKEEEVRDEHVVSQTVSNEDKANEERDDSVCKESMNNEENECGESNGNNVYDQNIENASEGKESNSVYKDRLDVDDEQTNYVGHVEVTKSGDEINKASYTVIENGVWIVNNKPMVVQKWDIDVDINKVKPDKLPIWVKLVNLPLEAWTVKGLSALASRLGKPVMMDNVTTMMCNQGIRRLGYARVLIKVEVKKGLPESIDIQYYDKDDKMSISKRVKESNCLQNKGRDGLGVKNKGEHERKDFDVVRNRRYNVGKNQNKENHINNNDRNYKYPNKNNKGVMYRVVNTKQNQADSERVNKERMERTVNITNVSPKSVWNVQSDILSGIERTANKYVVLQEEEVAEKEKDSKIEWMERINEFRNNVYGNNMKEMINEVEIELDENDVFIDKSANAKFMSENEELAMAAQPWNESERVQNYSGLESRANHSLAILICPSIVKKTHKAFRLANYITKKEEFGDIVKNRWEKSVHGYAMFQLLKGKLTDIYEKIDKDPLNKMLRETKVKLLNEYITAAQDEEKLLCLKAKVDWLRDGDRNSSYFHKVLKGKLNRSKIYTDMGTDGSIYENDQVGVQFVKHFESFLGSTSIAANMEDSDAYLFNKIDANNAEFMSKDVTKEEIKRVVFDIDDSKAPGPDGFTSKFFKKAWETIKDDFCKAIKEFFRTEKQLGKVNATLITLVPKIHTPLKWIMECISTPKFTICVNGERIGYFKGGRGLRQGDPISSYHHGGLHPNMSKSTIFCGSLSVDEKNTLLNILPFKIGKFLVRYLGVPLMDKNISVKDYKSLVDKVRHKLSDWKNKSLSYAGIKSLWVKWINTVKLKGKSVWDTQSYGSDSWCWKTILSLRQLVNDHVKSKIGNGKTISAWYDRWNEDQALINTISKRDVCQVGFNDQSRLCDIVDGNRWKWPDDWLRKHALF
ncbi:RNA-directed DNA polymerase, eukaryota, reverse transcriptase zinc-binding domain protein [Tanacetum coccineum]